MQSHYLLSFNLIKRNIYKLFFVVTECWMSYSLLLLLFSSAFGRAYRLITLENVSALDSLKKAATIKPTAFYESLLYALLRMCSIFEYERTLLA